MTTLKMNPRSDVVDVFAYGHWTAIHGLKPMYSKTLNVDGYDLKLKAYQDSIAKLDEAVGKRNKPLAESIRDDIFSNIPKESPMRDRINKQIKTMGVLH